ncbi:MAG: hypothetical protein EHM70_10315 [Chloroflexota bacterium]|nr:MAG: hypothetical protein EHM70_10315 [Chloroflexota bacterium]
MTAPLRRCVFAALFLLLFACTPGTPETAPTPTALPPKPQAVEFTISTGLKVNGLYYPASANPAPVIVLMHGGGGHMDDWAQVGMVQWLQNRGAAIDPTPAPEDDPRLLAPLPEGVSFAVMVFTFRGDAIETGIAALETARTLPGVDPNRLATMGSSVGADSAAAACAAIPGCLGSLGFSPVGSLNGVIYANTVTQMDAAGKAIWCIATEGDNGCPPATGERFHEIVKPGGAHGLGLFALPRYTGAWQDTAEFLNHVFGSIENE